MNLIERLVKELGVTPQQAEGGAGLLLGFAQRQLDKSSQQTNLQQSVYLPSQYDWLKLKEVRDRLKVAGITVDECGFTHLAYAREIASAMLRRQQAQAVAESLEQHINLVINNAHNR